MRAIVRPRRRCLRSHLPIRSFPDPAPMSLQRKGKRFCWRADASDLRLREPVRRSTRISNLLVQKAPDAVPKRGGPTGNSSSTEVSTGSRPANVAFAGLIFRIYWKSRDQRFGVSLIVAGVIVRPFARQPSGPHFGSSPFFRAMMTRTASLAWRYASQVVETSM